MLSFFPIKPTFCFFGRVHGLLMHTFAFVEPKRAMLALTFQCFSCEHINRFPAKLDLLFTVPEQ